MKKVLAPPIILSRIENNLKGILSLLEDQYIKPHKFDDASWDFLQRAPLQIFDGLKLLRGSDGYSKGSMLKWNFTGDMTSTRVTHLEDWTLKHDWYLYDVFRVSPPKNRLPFDKIVVGRESYDLALEREGYDINIPSIITLMFERNHCEFGALRTIEMIWLLSGTRWEPKYHRENNLPAVIAITKNKVDRKEYYLSGLKHDNNKYYGFDARKKNGTIEIRCPECGGYGRNTYTEERHGHDPAGMGWTAFDYVEEVPYEDRCHMCTMPLENRGRGWIAITKQNEGAIRKLALKNE